MADTSFDDLGTMFNVPGNTSDPIKLKLLRDQRHGEAMDNLANALGAGDLQEARRQKVIADQYEGDMATDLDTGTAATASASFMDPTQMALRAQKTKEAGNAAQTEAQGKALGTGTGTVMAANTPDAEKAANDAQARAITLKGAATPIPGMGPASQTPGSMGSYTNGAGQSMTYPLPPNMKPLGQLEQRALTSFHEAQPILDDLERSLGPDAANEGAIGQFGSWMKNTGSNALYKAGLATDPAQQAKTQLSGLLGIIGSSPYVVGSRSFQMIKLAMQHLTSPNVSDKFMKQQIDEIRSLWPRMQDEIIQAHTTPGAALNQGAGAIAGGDPYSDENYQPK